VIAYFGQAQTRRQMLPARRFPRRPDRGQEVDLAVLERCTRARRSEIGGVTTLFATLTGFIFSVILGTSRHLKKT
jgi:hypothetical protein